MEREPTRPYTGKQIILDFFPTLEIPPYAECKCSRTTQQSSHRKFGGILSDIIRSDTLNENLRFDT